MMCTPLFFFSFFFCNSEPKSGRIEFIKFLSMAIFGSQHRSPKFHFSQSLSRASHGSLLRHLHELCWDSLHLGAHFNTHYNILKRYLFHLAPYLKQSTLFPGNFIQIESEPTENGLSEINTSLKGILLNKWYFITASKTMSEELEVLELTLSSIQKKLAKKER